jgi:hypothetical protein
MYEFEMDQEWRTDLLLDVVPLCGAYGLDVTAIVPLFRG